MSKLRKFRIPTLSVVALIVLYDFGPNWIASYYLSQATPAEIQHYKDIYWERAEKDVSDQKRDNAKLWCSIRGIELDDGHFQTSTWEKWQMIFKYLKR